MALSKRLRYEILRRDQFTCRYCGQSAPDVKLHVDHLIPVTLGGSDDPTNLVTACVDCNLGKSSASADDHVVEDVAKDALRWSKAVSKAFYLRSIDRAVADDVVEEFNRIWSDWTYDDGTTVTRPASWEDSVRNWYAIGFDIKTLTALIGVAMRKNLPDKDTWNYFCGCIWRTLDDVQRDARSILNTEEERGRG